MVIRNLIVYLRLILLIKNQQQAQTTVISLLDFNLIAQNSDERIIDHVEISFDTEGNVRGDRQIQQMELARLANQSQYPINYEMEINTDNEDEYLKQIPIAKEVSEPSFSKYEM